MTMIRRRLVSAAARSFTGHSPGEFSHPFNLSASGKNAAAPRSYSSLVPKLSPPAPRMKDLRRELMFPRIPTRLCSSASSPAAKKEEEGEKQSPVDVVMAEVLQEMKPEVEEEAEVELSPAAARELADAKEFMDKYQDMLKLRSRLQQAFGTLGMIQLLSGWWIVATDYSAETLYFFYTALSATLSLQIALLLHRTIKPLPKKVDTKGMFVPLWTIRSVNHFMGRVNLATLVALTGMTGVLAYEVVPSLNSYLS